MDHNCLDFEPDTMDEYGVESRCPICGEIYACWDPALPPYDGPMCNVFIEWSSESSLVLQVRNAKRLFKDMKKHSNDDLLRMARANHRWHVGELTLPEGKGLVVTGKEQQLDIIYEIVERLD